MMPAGPDRSARPPSAKERQGNIRAGHARVRTAYGRLRPPWMLSTLAAMTSVSVSSSGTGGLWHTCAHIGGLCLVASALVSTVVLASGVSLSAPRTTSGSCLPACCIASVGLQRISDALVEPLPGPLAGKRLAQLADRAVVAADTPQARPHHRDDAVCRGARHSSRIADAVRGRVAGLGASFATAYPDAWRWASYAQRLESGGGDGCLDAAGTR